MASGFQNDGIVGAETADADLGPVAGDSRFVPWPDEIYSDERANKQSH